MSNSSWDLPLDSFEHLKHTGYSRNEPILHRPWSDNIMTWKDSAAPSVGFSNLSLSPPQVRQLSPEELDLGRHPNLMQTDSRPLHAPDYNATFRTSELRPTDEPDLVCIKLLAYLRRTGTDEHHSLDDVLGLIQRALAAVRRILTSRKARSDYSCIMLLSNILVQVVKLCEKACSMHFEERQSETPELLTTFGEDFFTAFGEPCDLSPKQKYSNMHEDHSLSNVSRQRLFAFLLENVAEVSTEISELLRGKPLTGFQAIGKHECLHMDLERRLMEMLNLLAPWCSSIDYGQLQGADHAQ